MIIGTHKNLATNTVPEEDVEKLEILRDKVKEELKKSKLKILFIAILQSHIDIIVRRPKVWFGSCSSTYSSPKSKSPIIPATHINLIYMGVR